MSSEKQELKAGHPPAVKAGGMRVVTKHKHKDQDPDAYDNKYRDSVNPIGGPNKIDIKQDVSLSGGVVANDTAQHQTAAVRLYHDKPQPTHEKTHAPPKQMNITQPRRN
jgi:hypothetical protein